MKVDIVTLFPELFAPFLEWSMVKKAREIKALTLRVHNLRKWAIDKRGTVDDRSYGGGPGMILRPEPVFSALKKLKRKNSKVILLSAGGKTLNQERAIKMAKLKHLILVCGHYEGVDHRIRKYMVDEEISVGRYVLSGGELPAMIIVDAVARLLPGVLEKEGAAEIESFSPGLKKLAGKKGDLIEFPQYTRPPTFHRWKVPQVLLSGNHEKIKQWRKKQIKVVKK